MLAAVVNAHVAAMVLGVNGQGRFAERTLTADAMLLAIEEAAAAWVTRNIGGIASLLGVVPDTIEAAPMPIRWQVAGGYDAAYSVSGSSA